MNFLNVQPERNVRPDGPVDPMGVVVMQPEQGHEQRRPEERHGRRMFGSTLAGLNGREEAFKKVLCQVNSSHNAGGTVLT